jgi:N-acetylmuramoyl-L-alanine amidase
MMNNKIVLKGRKIIRRKYFINKNNYLNKVRKRKVVFKILLLVIFLFVLAGTLFITYNTIFKEDKVTIKLAGDEELNLEVFDKYKEQGIELVINNNDVSDDITYKGKVNTDKLGTYIVEYIYNDKVYATRTINVVDTTDPIISLNGTSEVSLVETSKYNEEGATSIDNYDGDITKELKIEQDVDINKVGEYIVTYTVTDISGNKALITRKVIVTAKPKAIIQKVVVEDNSGAPVAPPAEPGFVTTMSFTGDGFTINGCASKGTIPTSLSLNDSNYNITVNSNCYSSTVNLSNLANGIYTLYLNSASSKEKVVDKLDALLQIKRARVGNKLVTFDYTNNNVSINVQDFYYEYDVVIDVGHGGWDTGATNIYNQEKNMNLAVSLYEKQKYEAAGLKVLITRTDDSYGAGMGNFSKALYNRAYYIGYYGVTSKVIYSNHHNSSSYSGATGFEMYTSNSMSNMNTELSIFNSVADINKANNIYARDYETGTLYSKKSGQVYNYKNYYGILRIPSELFNINSITIYESCYLSNIDDYINYWNNENWKKISDIKVQYYISKINAL